MTLATGWRLVVVLVVGGVGCGDTSPRGAAGDGDAWSLTPTVTIAASDQDTTRQFTRPDAIVAADGIVLVREQHQQAIRAFTPDGQYLRTVGRAGSGPGEFRELAAFGVLADTLWTIDWGLRRVSLFLLNGTFLTSWQLETIGGTLGSATRLFRGIPSGPASG